MKRPGRPRGSSESSPARPAAWDRRSESNVAIRLVPDIPFPSPHYCGADMEADFFARSTLMPPCRDAIHPRHRAPQRRVLDTLGAIGKFVDVFDEAGHRVVGHSIAAELDEIRRAKFRARLQHYRDLDLVLTEF